MEGACTHVVGGGLAGLAAAMAAVERGDRAIVYEAGPAAGGRCRSYFDRGLGVRLDNGNHLMLSGNTETMAYLERIGARASLTGPGEAHFPFHDLGHALRYVFAPGPGRVPWWLLRGGIPGITLRDGLALASLLRVPADATVHLLLGHRPMLFRRLIEPLAVAALNTPPDEALASLLARVVLETLGRGGMACIPAFPRLGLSESLVDPAVAWLVARGASVLTGRRIAGLEIVDQRVARLLSPDGPVALAADDRVVLAVPAWVAADLLPGLVTPDAFQAILNVHFRTCVAAAGAIGRAGFVGLIGGDMAEWVFVKPDVVSVTVSAANRHVDLDAATIAQRVWPDVRTALDLPEPMPPVRVVKERRATFAATAAQERRRPGPRTGMRNLALAGDWTATGLPATIEGAIRSGRAATQALAA